MRVILKQQDVLMKCGWVERKHNRIYGWFGGKSSERHFPLDMVERTDVHFTYPEDGNLHYSFKRYENGKLRRVENIFHDRRRIKDFPEDGSPRTVRDELFPEDPNERPIVLLPSWRLPPLLDYGQRPLIFQFPVLALNVFDAKITVFPTDVISELRADDVVVDVAACSNGALNIFLHLYGRGFHPTPNDAGHFVAVRRDTKIWPTIELSALLIPLGPQ